MRGSLVTVCIVIFLAFHGISMLFPILPVYAEKQGASVAEVGLIIFSYMMLAAILTIPFGIVSDRYGRRLPTVIGAFVSGVMLSCISLARNPYQIMLIYSIVGIGNASWGPSVTAFVGDISVRKMMGRAYGWAGMSRQAAFSIGPSVGAIVASLWGYPNTFIIAGAMLLLTTPLSLWSFTMSKASSSEKSRKLAPRLQNVFKNRTIMVSLLATFCIFYVMSVFTSFVPIYANRIGIATSFIGLILTTQAVCNATSRLLSGRYSDKTGKRASLAILALLSSSAAIGAITSTRILVVIFASAALLGFSMGTVALMLSTLIAETSSADTRGLAMGLHSTCLYAGLGIGPAATGFIILEQGFDLGFKTAAIMPVMGAIIFFIIAKKKHLL